jgi:zinc-ribbon domain
MITCPSCQSDSQDDARFCIRCGTPLRPAAEQAAPHLPLDVAQPNPSPAPVATQPAPSPAADATPPASLPTSDIMPSIGDPAVATQSAPSAWPDAARPVGLVASPALAANFGLAGSVPPGYAPFPGYPPYPAYVPRPPKDRSIALILEILPGLFGFIGFGWMYSGNTTAGLIWLISVLIWDFIGVGIVLLTGGLACFCTVPANLVLIAASASFLNSYTHQHPELFG